VKKDVLKLEKGLNIIKTKTTLEKDGL